MNDEKILSPDAELPFASEKPDLDDLIFSGEGWQVSDR